MCYTVHSESWTTLARIVTFYQYWWSVISLVAAGMYSQKYMMWWCHHCSNIIVCLNLDTVNQFIWLLVAISSHANMRCVRWVLAEYITPLNRSAFNYTNIYFMNYTELWALYLFITGSTIGLIHQLHYKPVCSI